MTTTATAIPTLFRYYLGTITEVSGQPDNPAELTLDVLDGLGIRYTVQYADGELEPDVSPRKVIALLGQGGGGGQASVAAEGEGEGKGEADEGSAVVKLDKKQAVMAAPQGVKGRWFYGLVSKVWMRREVHEEGGA